MDLPWPRLYLRMALYVGAALVAFVLSGAAILARKSPYWTRFTDESAAMLPKRNAAPLGALLSDSTFFKRRRHRPYEPTDVSVHSNPQDKAIRNKEPPMDADGRE